MDSQHTNQVTYSAEADWLIPASAEADFVEVGTHAAVKPDVTTKSDSETNSSIDDDEAMYGVVMDDSDTDDVSTTTSNAEFGEWHAIGVRLAALLRDFEDEDPPHAGEWHTSGSPVASLCLEIEQQEFDVAPRVEQWHAVGARLASVFLEFADSCELDW